MTSVIEMLELPNFGHMNTSTIQFESHDKIFQNAVNTNYDVVTFISKYIYFKKAQSFVEIIKTIITVKAVFKDSKKVKKLEVMHQSAIYIYIS